MTREELRRALARLVRGGKLSKEAARSVLRAFDRGDLSQAQLPLSAAESGASIDEAFAAAAFREMLRREGLAAHQVRLLSSDGRQRITISIMENFDEVTFDATRRLRTGRIGVRRWHQEMREKVARDLVEQAQLGKGRPLTQAELRRLEPALRRQMAHLRRFATEVAARDVIDAPMSEAKVADRARIE